METAELQLQSLVNKANAAIASQALTALSPLRTDPVKQMSALERQLWEKSVEVLIESLEK